MVGGFQSYYGAMLCCSFSADGRYVAAGGEDDMVVVYSVHDRYPVAHCEGHGSWVSRVSFDRWMECGQGGGGASGLGGASGGAIYRLASVGQDAQMCFWDVQIQPLEGDLFAMPVVANAMRCCGRVHTSCACWGGGGWAHLPCPAVLR